MLPTAIRSRRARPATLVRKAVLICRLDNSLDLISRGNAELVKLDSMGLTASSLQPVLALLATENVGSNVMTISLSDNLLDNDACRQLLEALKMPQFCPSLLAINLQGNSSISSEGYAVLDEIVTIRTELQARSPLILVASHHFALRAASASQCIMSGRYDTPLHVPTDDSRIRRTMKHAAQPNTCISLGSCLCDCGRCDTCDASQIHACDYC